MSDKIKEVSKIILSCLESQRQWIFLPSKIKAEISTNGTDYTVKTYETGEVKNQPEPVIHELVMEFSGEKARYIKIKAENIKTCPSWHRGAGGKSWIFIDEIIIE